MSDPALPLTQEVAWPPPEPVVTDTAVTIPDSDEPEPHYDPEDYGLPDFDVIDVCPKCASENKINRKYHATLHLSEPCGATYAHEAQANGWKFPQHVCHSCSACGAGWASKVAIL